MWVGLVWLVVSLGRSSALGQPEEPQALGLPSDQDSFNHLSPMAAPPYSGTYHFVSSSFPEIDSRGFYENVFDGVGDYYPVWEAVLAKKKRSSMKIADIFPQVSLIRSKREIRNTSKEHLVEKRSPMRHGRGMDGMGSSGFHENAFNTAFGDFVTMRRKKRERQDSTEHKDVVSPRQTQSKLHSLLHSLYLYQHQKNPLKRIEQRFNENNLPSYFDSVTKRRPEMDSMGFHGDTFGGSFGNFETMKKRRPEMDSMGFHGDTFGGSFSDFETMRKRRPEMDSMGFHGDTFGGSFGDFETMKKRRPEMDSMGFHGDTFGGSFGDFETMKKRRPEMDSMGFHGDTFGGSFGDFETMKKRRPEMDSMGFHGDTFGGSFGDFETMKKRRPEMDSMGFHGDTFGGNFGTFDTMKRRPEMDSMGFHGDTFGGSFGDFETMKKRRPEMDSMGFHGDTFGGSFGDFETMKKRRPEMDSMGFHGDTFGGSFGNFETMRKKRLSIKQTNLEKDKKKELKLDDCNCDEISETKKLDNNINYMLNRSCLQKCKLNNSMIQ